MAEFNRSLAVVIGINEYQDYPKLQTARYDAERLAEILAIEHKYDYVILVADETYKEYLKGQELPVKNKYQPTLNDLLNLLSKRLPSEINPTKEDRLLFYFAGHGIPDNSDEGPKGYLVPLDADSKKRDSLLPMQELYKYLAALNCRHFLVVLDCCFAGRFRWSSTRKGGTFPRVIHKEHYDRFINSPAWQAITSASHDQEAFDTLCDSRGTVEGTNHSPFAEGLFRALQGEADVFPASKNGQPAGDGVITATELYLYLRDHVEIGSKERQTPGLWSLPKHERGEYIFLAPGAELKLKPAPKVNEKNNPYRGLESFDEEHSQFFFGRKELIKQLLIRVSAPKQPLTVVLGVSGSGKSSIVKAGLIPCFKKLSKSDVFAVYFVSAYILTSAVVQAFSQVSPKFLPINYAHHWRILKPMRPGEQPFKALAKAILPLADVTDSNQPDSLNFLKVSDRLDSLNFISEVLKLKVEYLDKKIADSSYDNGEESSETLRLKKEVEKLISITKGWKQDTQKAKQLVIVEHEEELYTLCRNSAEKQQLQQVVSDCLDPLSLRLQSDPNQLIDIVRAWSHKNPGVKLLLTIDQLEELITLSQSKEKDKQNNQQQQHKKPSNQATQEVQQENKQEEWQQFLSLLEKALSANLEQLRIIVTLRSDFEPRFLNSDALKSHWTKARFPVRAMYPDELRQAIERPAAEMALYFQPSNLVDRLIGEVGQMPGALPLLSFTLSELYLKLAEKWRLQETSDRALKLDADFDKEGGVAGSLTRRANKEYDDLLDDDKRATLRRVMLRMVTTEGGESARRRVPRSEFVYADDEENKRVKEVIDRLVEARLIISGQATGESYVEPAHDFLVRSWDKLQQWQQKEQRDLLLQRQLTPVALEWKSKEQSSSLLGKTEPFWDWCDKRIDSAEDLLNKIKKNVQERLREKKRQFLWNGNPYLDVLKNRLKAYDYWFNQVETEFVQQSVWQRRRYTIAFRGAVIVVILVLSRLTWWALSEQRKAVINQISTSRQASEALFLSNEELDALISSAQAGKNFSYPLLQAVPPNPQLRKQVVQTLRKVFYGMRERNRWKPMQGMEVRSMFFHPNGQLLIATKSHNDTVQLWDIKRKEQPVIQLPGHQFKGDSSDNVFFSPDGSKIATLDSTGKVRLWDWNGNNLGRNFQVGYRINEFSFSPNSEAFFTRGYDNKEHYSNIHESVRWWNIQGRNQTLDKNTVGFGFKSDNSPIVAYQKDDGIILSGLSSQPIPIPNIIKPSSEEVRVSFSRDGNYIVFTEIYGSSFHTKMWNWNGTKLEEVVVSDIDKIDKAHIAEAQINSFSADGKLVAFAVNNTVRIYNLSAYGESALTNFNEIKLPSGTVQSIIFSQDGKELATQDENGTVRLWDVDVPQPNESNQYQFLQDGIQNISFSPDRKTVATVGNDGTTIRVFDPSGKQLSEFPATSSKVTGISFSPNGKIIATGSDNGTVSLFRQNGKELGSIKAHSKNVIGVVFSPDGQRLATLGSDSEDTDGADTYLAKLWRLDSDKLELEKSSSKIDSSYTVYGIKFQLNDEPRIVTEDTFSGAVAATVSQWNMSGERQDILLGEIKPERSDSLAFSPDGSLLASVGTDSKNIVKLWDLQGRKLLTKFQGHECNIQVDKCITSISFSPDGSTLAVIGSDGSAKLWQLGSFDDLLAKGCDRMRDYLTNLDETSSDRHLCDGIGKSQP
ncbi:nSTAND1 domain-containing NTPase [Lyngbya aestuarii]|uniref:nSTAND1 domain-containing NTPase n=1 Tax=Lyngbya aestuarii TaxID=118322 RepID=UPI00403D90FE